MPAGDPFRAPPEARPRPRTAPDPGVLLAPVSVRTKRGNEALAARGIDSAGGLLETAPRAYRDYGSEVESLAGLAPGWALGYRAARAIDDAILRTPLRKLGSNFEILARIGV